MGLGKPRRKQKRASAQGRRRPRTDEPSGDSGSEEAANFIAETAASLAKLARRYEFDLLAYLLAMSQLEAEEQVKLIRRRRLS
jgi:hypothetical protein